MLETTLATTFIPGTNLKWKVAGANWTFLLPSLELEQVVCFGAPPSTTLATLSRVGQDVAVICANARQVRWARAAIRRCRAANVRLITPNGQATLPLKSGSVDLALISGGGEARRLNRDRALPAELRRVLKPEGLIYLEFGGPLAQRLDHDATRNVIEGHAAPPVFWLTPLAGEMHTAVPLRDRETIDYFQHHGLYSSSIRLPLFERAERLLNRHRLFGRLARRYGALVGGAAAHLTDAPPRYLRSIARQAGVDIDHHRWGLSARGEYSSRKVLFFLFERASDSPDTSPDTPPNTPPDTPPDTPPEYIVKMTRDPALNPRLENEYGALTRLREKGIGDRETLPQAVFFGQHGGLAIVGETMIDGEPFRQRSRATADCSYVRAAIDWLLELGAATADRTSATPVQVASALETLFRRFVQVYRLAPAHRDFLADQIAAIRRRHEAFPLVFQHGDPGAWNAVVTQSGRVAFLDWEAAEPQGMPLWDLFYFLRSYCVGAARAGGTRNRLAGFAQHFLAESPLSPLVIESTRRYCERIALPARLIEPLFYTCWMHRALKESTRLTPAKLDRGHYVGLLRLCIAQRDAPTRGRLFSL